MNLKGLDSLDSVIADKGPTSLDYIYYAFFEKGIGLEKVNSYPLPYIFRVLRTLQHIKSEEEKAMKKARRK